jgi:hypothetical protein
MGDTFCLIPAGITAIMSSSVFLYVGFLFLAPPREDTVSIKMRAHELTQTAPAPAISAHPVRPPLPNSVPHQAKQPEPTSAARSLAVASLLPNRVPHEAAQTAPAPAPPSIAVASLLPYRVPHEAAQTAPPPTPSSIAVASPLPNNVQRETTQAAPAPAMTPHYLASVSRFFTVYSAQEKGMSYQQYRARLEYLRKQQAEIELRLADPDLPTGERSRLERQNAYWSRAIRQMLVVP